MKTCISFRPISPAIYAGGARIRSSYICISANMQLRVMATAGPKDVGVAAPASRVRSAAIHRFLLPVSCQYILSNTIVIVQRSSLIMVPRMLRDVHLEDRRHVLRLIVRDVLRMSDGSTNGNLSDKRCRDVEQ